MRASLLLFLLFAINQCGFGYKVLVYSPFLGHSHTNFLGKIADILAADGNDVTLLMPQFFVGKNGSTGSKLVKNVIRLSMSEEAAKVQGDTRAMFEEAVWVESKNKDFILRVVTTVPAIGAFQCKDLFERKELLESLQNEKFDLAIAQPMQLCPYIFFDQLGISTVISASSTITMEPIRSSLGEPDDYNYVPATMAKMAEVSSWTETILNYLHNTAGGWYFEYSFSEEVDAVKDLVPDLKSWRDYMGNVAFAFVNSNPYLDYPRPYLPKSVPVGGMQVETEKIGLSKEWDEILSKRKTNVLISFGSNAHSSKMPDEFKKGFREVFTSMPETTFIWKYEEPNPTLVGDLPNVHLTVWMPQNALLADPRLNLFVTHGGLGSSMELAYIGVPAVVIPLMADQFRNGHMLARHGGAKILNKQDLAHGDVIRAAVKEILETPSYKKNAEKLAQVLRDQPLSPKESVLKHCNFAVKHGSLDTISSPSRLQNIPWITPIDFKNQWHYLKWLKSPVFWACTVISTLIVSDVLFQTRFRRRFLWFMY